MTTTSINIPIKDILEVRAIRSKLDSSKICEQYQYAIAYIREGEHKNTIKRGLIDTEQTANNLHSDTITFLINEHIDKRIKIGLTVEQELMLVMKHRVLLRTSDQHGNYYREKNDYEFPIPLDFNPDNNVKVKTLLAISQLEQFYFRIPIYSDFPSELYGKLSFFKLPIILLSPSRGLYFIFEVDKFIERHKLFFEEIISDLKKHSFSGINSTKQLRSAIIANNIAKAHQAILNGAWCGPTKKKSYKEERGKVSIYMSDSAIELAAKLNRHEIILLMLKHLENYEPNGKSFTYDPKSNFSKAMYHVHQKFSPMAIAISNNSYESIDILSKWHKRVVWYTYTHQATINNSFNHARDFSLQYSKLYIDKFISTPCITELGQNIFCESIENFLQPNFLTKSDESILIPILKKADQLGSKNLIDLLLDHRSYAKYLLLHTTLYLKIYSNLDILNYLLGKGATFSKGLTKAIGEKALENNTKFFKQYKRFRGNGFLSKEHWYDLIESTCSNISWSNQIINFFFNAGMDLTLNSPDGTCFYNLIPEQYDELVTKNNNIYQQCIMLRSSLKNDIAYELLKEIINRNDEDNFYLPENKCLTKTYSKERVLFLLHIAAQNGCKKIIELILSKTPLDKQQELLNTIEDKYGCTTLNYAYSSGSSELIEYLFHKGAYSIWFKDDANYEEPENTENDDVDTFKIINSIVLMIHEFNKDKVTIETIINKLASTSYFYLNLCNIEGYTPMMAASLIGDAQLIACFITNKEDKVSINFNIQGINKKTALHIAIENGHYDVTSQLLPYSDITIEDDEGLNPLHWAIKKNAKDIVKQLVNKHPNILQIKNSKGLTPIEIAIDEQKPEIIRELHQLGSDIHYKVEEKYSLLWSAIKNNKDIDTIVCLIDLKLCPNECYLHDMNFDSIFYQKFKFCQFTQISVLGLAIFKGNADAAIALLSAGANPQKNLEVTLKIEKDDIIEEKTIRSLLSLVTEFIPNNEKLFKLMIESGAGIHFKTVSSNYHSDKKYTDELEKFELDLKSYKEKKDQLNNEKVEKAQKHGERQKDISKRRNIIQDRLSDIDQKIPEHEHAISTNTEDLWVPLQKEIHDVYREKIRDSREKISTLNNEKKKLRQELIDVHAESDDQTSHQLEMEKYSNDIMELEQKISCAEMNKPTPPDAQDTDKSRVDNLFNVLHYVAYLDRASYVEILLNIECSSLTYDQVGFYDPIKKSNIYCNAYELAEKKENYKTVRAFNQFYIDAKKLQMEESSPEKPIQDVSDDKSNATCRKKLSDIPSNLRFFNISEQQDLSGSYSQLSYSDDTLGVQLSRIDIELLKCLEEVNPSKRKINQLLKQGANIDAQSLDDGYTCLMLAVDKNNENIITYLLKKNANPLLLNDDEEKASDLCQSDSNVHTLLVYYEFIYAAKTGNKSIIDDLLDSLDINWEDHHEHAALYYAVINDHLDIATTLVANGSDTSYLFLGDKVNGSIHMSVEMKNYLSSIPIDTESNVVNLDTFKTSL